jgi:hypothetical protein
LITSQILPLSLPPQRVSHDLIPNAKNRLQETLERQLRVRLGQFLFVCVCIFSHCSALL